MTWFISASRKSFIYHWRPLFSVEARIVPVIYTGIPWILWYVRWATTRSEGFLFAQLLGFMYRLLRRIVTKLSLPREYDRNTIHKNVFGGRDFLAVSDFMRKGCFRTAELRVVKPSEGVEKDTWSKKSGTQLMTSNLVNGPWRFMWILPETVSISWLTVSCLTICGNLILWRAWKISTFVFYLNCQEYKLRCAIVVCTTVLLSEIGAQKL